MFDNENAANAVFKRKATLFLSSYAASICFRVSVVDLIFANTCFEVACLERELVSVIAPIRDG